MSHALLSPSSSERWINSPASVKYQILFQEERSPYAQEGSEAHLYAEHLLKKNLGMKTRNPKNKLEFYSKEMEECAEGYVVYINEIMASLTKPKVYVEEKLNLSMYIPEAYGTADAIIAGGEELHIVDFKYGLGIQVDARNNSQLMIYALGALYLFDGIYDFTKVTMHIYQPRRTNISSFSMTPKDLYKWAEEVLKPKALEAINGQGEFKDGPWMRFWPAKSRGRRRAEYVLECLKYDFKKPELLMDSEIEDILAIIPSLESWIVDVKEYALEEAQLGKTWQNFKLVEGRSTRKYGDEEKIVETVKKLGYDPYEKKLLGITKMTKLLGKEEFDKHLSPYISKPQGKPILVPRSDSRPEIANAKDEFSKIEGEE
ncbi:DUF2800 domain-containing protein [Allofustis seminis]|uniref:DUF2800 domain-containing protein n=1 Tax=Allofustis seminis TaxID=166939 RepID=UPI0003627459|nr:DUF2800 domain-containing protein [Allofustis seminis]